MSADSRLLTIHKKCVHFVPLIRLFFHLHSHSTVPGGLCVMSYPTAATPGRFSISSAISRTRLWGNSANRAVIKSGVVIGRKITNSWWRITLDSAISKPHNAPGTPRHIFFMGHHQNCLPLLVKVFKRRSYLLTRSRIQIPGGFICQQSRMSFKTASNHKLSLNAILQNGKQK